MLKTLIFTCSLLYFSNCLSQFHEVGFFLGGSNYIGDIGTDQYIDPNSPAVGLIYKWTTCDSVNLYIATPTIQYLSKVHFYGWRRGLKTGSYYIHSQPSSKNIQVTIPFSERNSENTSKQRAENTGDVCRMEEGCISCGS